MVLRDSQPQTTTTITPPGGKIRTEGGVLTPVEGLKGLNSDGDLGELPLTTNGHAPSYLKLSCAVSGYSSSSYKSYGSPTTNLSINGSNGSLDNNSHQSESRDGRSVSPMGHVVPKVNGITSPGSEPIPPPGSNRTDDSVDSSLLNHKNTRISQSLSARDPPKVRTPTDKTCKSASYRDASREASSDHVTAEQPSREDMIIQNGPMKAFCDDSSVVFGRDDNCDIGSVDNVVIVTSSDTTIHDHIEDNSDSQHTRATIPKLHLKTDITTTELDTPTKVI